VIKVGVFDSGIGGLSIANAIRRDIIGVEVIFINDVDNLPYGSKSPDELRALVRPHLDYLRDQLCDVIVVACNTLSTTVIPEMEALYDMPLISVIPMIKPASQLTVTKTVAVCATPTTLASPVYSNLKSLYGEGINFTEPYCGDWAKMIETDTLDRSKVEQIIDNVCNIGADVIVLGCTHYHWIEEIIKDAAKGRAKVIQPELAVVARVKRELELLA
jgi:glutamate racemase